MFRKKGHLVVKIEKVRKTVACAGAKRKDSRSKREKSGTIFGGKGAVHDVYMEQNSKTAKNPGGSERRGKATGGKSVKKRSPRHNRKKEEKGSFLSMRGENDVRLD